MTKRERAVKDEKVIPPGKPTEEKYKKDTKLVIKLPYPQRVKKKDPSESDFEKLVTMFKKIKGQMSFFEAFERMPMYKKFMEEVMAKKKPTTEEQVPLKEKCCASSLEQKIPNKQKDPGTVLIDSGASVILMPLSIYHKLGLKSVSDTKINMKFADHSRNEAYGVAEDVLVKIEDLSFPVDFVILDIPEDEETPIILGRHFMQTSRYNLDMDQGTITLKVYDKVITLNTVKNRELEVEKEHHYQVNLVRKEVRRQSNRPTSEKDPRRPSQVSPLPIATSNGKTPIFIPKAKRKKRKQKQGLHSALHKRAKLIISQFLPFRIWFIFTVGYHVLHVFQVLGVLLDYVMTISSSG
ncbi:uncharacterized protein LOC127093822 [Lathyrus oleraceus]|uniref:uncharacterized protein LOC127093822 n=1 Tax=Pisum sativum TaxID=3888 RepID=UPI0021D0564D|nr:uncharacterized protein LOC127093822 [Pisum sativum]